MSTLHDTLRQVRTEDPVGYGSRVFDSELDRKMTAFVDAFVAASPLEREALGSERDPRLASVMRVYAERQASLAVRRASGDELFRGFVALGAEGFVADAREDLLVLSLLFDAARRLRVDPREAVERAREFITAPAARYFEQFLARGPADQAIEAMGYRAGTDAGGFRYERTW
jgi:hypothetical protein